MLRASLIVLLSLTFYMNVQAQQIISTPYEKEIYSIEIFKLPILTAINVSGLQFLKDWKSDLEIFNISSPSQRKRIFKDIKTAAPAPERRNEIYTRGIFLIKYKSGKIDTLCIGTNTVALLNNIAVNLPSEYLLQVFDNLNQKSKHASVTENETSIWKINDCKIENNHAIKEKRIAGSVDLVLDSQMKFDTKILNLLIKCKMVLWHNYVSKLKDSVRAIIPTPRYNSNNRMLLISEAKKIRISNSYYNVGLFSFSKEEGYNEHNSYDFLYCNELGIIAVYNVQQENPYYCPEALLYQIRKGTKILDFDIQEIKKLREYFAL